MTRVHYKAWAQDSAGNKLPSADVRVQLQSDSSEFTVYNAKTGGSALTQPFQTGSDGSFDFYADPGEYNVLVGSGASQITYPVSLDNVFDGDEQAKLASLDDLGAIAKAVASGAIADCRVNPWATPGDHFAWMLDGSKSWAKEDRVTATYLGVHANEAAARAVSGASDGDWYWNDTDKRCYALNVGSGQTEHYRFGAAHFDAQFAVAYSDRVILVDGDGVPWMVFETKNAPSADMATATTTISSVCFVGSQLVIGTAQGGWGMSVVDFAADAGAMYFLGTKQKYNGDISQRNDGLGYYQIAAVGLVNATVNAVAATVLDNAPADPVTGLPVPTIAVATDGGVSVIKDDGTVVDITTGVCEDVSIAGGGLSIKNGQYVYRGPFPNADTTIGAWRDWWMDHTSAGSLTLQSQSLGAAVGESVACSNGLTRIWENPANPASGMVAYQAPDYVTPPMFGDVKAALLCERGAASLVGGEIGPDLSSYADQAAAVSDGWSSVGSAWTFDAVNDEWVHDGSANSNIVYDTDPLIAGEPYVAHFDVENGGGVTFYVGTGSEVGSYQVGLGVGSHTVTLLAGSQGDYIQFRRTSGAPQVKNIRFSRATPDRSVNGKHAVIHGTLSRDADGWVSGFTASDYVEQPYNSDLDFGTGDFFVGAPVRRNGDVYFTIMDRKGAASVDRVFFGATGSGSSNLYFAVGPGAALLGSDNLPDECFIWAYRKAGVLHCGYDDRLDSASVANTSNLDGSELAPTIFGKRHDNNQILDGGASMRQVVIFEGVPSLAQIRVMSNWKGDVIEGTIHDTDYVESAQGLWVLTSSYLYEIGPDGAERSKQVNDIGATTLTAFHGGRLVS